MSSPHAHIPFQRIPEHIDVIRHYALNLEIYFGAAILDSVPLPEITDLKKRLDYNPELSIHAPFMDLSPGAVDSMVRTATMERFRQILDVAEVLRPKTVVFHSGYEKWKYALNVDLWLEKSLLTWREVSERAAGMGLKVAIENIFEDEPSNLKLLMENMKSDNFGICFDTGHFNLFSKLPLAEWMESLNPYIFELHLHDNDGTSDQHLPIGDGTFDFREFFGLLRNLKCVYTIESHTPENVLRSMESLRELTLELQ
ncbi:MAG: sugar phosphate isomerase/epimerase [Candidatus Sulfobium sp.]